MKLYVVLEEDRGIGETVLDVFADKVTANRFCENSSRYYVQEVESNGIKPQLCDVLAQIADKEFILDDDRCVRVAYLEKIFSKYFT